MAFTPSYSAAHDFGSGEYVYGVGAVPGRVIVLAYSKFFYSTDAGATWTAGDQAKSGRRRVLDSNHDPWWARIGRARNADRW